MSCSVTLVFPTKRQRESWLINNGLPLKTMKVYDAYKDDTNLTFYINDPYNFKLPIKNLLNSLSTELRQRITTIGRPILNPDTGEDFYPVYVEGQKNDYIDEFKKIGNDWTWANNVIACTAERCYLTHIVD